MLYDILKTINPVITRESVICQNDGNGEYIAKWDASLGPQPTQAQIDAAMPLALMKAREAELSAAVDEVLDAGARFLEYRNILSLSSYDNSANSTFRTQALAAIAWRDAVWTHCRSVRAEVLAGTRPLPTKDELLAELPARPW